LSVLTKHKKSLAIQRKIEFLHQPKRAKNVCSLE